MKRFAVLLAVLLPLVVPSLRAEELPGRYEITEGLPDGYETPIERRGRVEEFKYSTPNGEKSALVYLPYGYDNFYSRFNAGSIAARPFFYLMHGGGEDQTCYFSKEGPSPRSSDRRRQARADYRRRAHVLSQRSRIGWVRGAW